MNQDRKLLETVASLNIIDDALFRKMAEDSGFCEEVISTILGKKIRIIETVEQRDIKNLQGRSVILDALCEDEEGRQYNIEVQKSDDDDHQKRVRYNASCITANFTKTGSNFIDIPDVIVIFISRFDLFKSGKTVYHVERVIRETGEVIDNGFQEIYVNAAVNDGSDIAGLMEIFTDAEKYDAVRFPATSKRKSQFKKGEKGADNMCDVVLEYAKEYGKAVEAKKMLQMIENCSDSLGKSIEESCAILKVSYTDYQNAKVLAADL